jgi:hypothetical protein
VAQEDTRLHWRSIRNYLSAITDTWMSQQLRGMNSHPNPRGKATIDFIKSLQRRNTELQRQQFTDKGKDTLLDGYSLDQFEALCSKLWANGGRSPECYFRTLVDALIGHYLLARGDDRRRAEISDLFTFEFPDEGPTKCFPLIFTTREGKTNQHGRLETAGALRHKNPVTCLLSGIAYYLLFRWDFTEEPFPDFTDRSRWYRTRLLRGNRATTSHNDQGISYSTQRDWMAKAFAMVGIVASKITHLPRATAAKLAELKGVVEDEIRRAGRWNHDQMTGCYLNSLPRRFMRRMAGHPEQMGCFEIRRASIEPPEELLHLIWPELDQWKGKFGSLDDQIHDLSASGLVDLLVYLRVVILQDSVILRRQSPDNMIWSHPVFCHASYHTYAKQLEAYLNENSSVSSQFTVLQQAVPQLVDHLQAITTKSVQLEAKTDTNAIQLKEHLDKRIDDVSSLLISHISRQNELISQKVISHFRTTLVASLTSNLSNSLDISGPMTDTIATIPTSSTSSTQPISSTPATSGDHMQHPPRYRMSRHARTVEHLWIEWTKGFNGGPSIDELDRQWGTSWRSGRRDELQWYSLRLEVIKEIRRNAEKTHISQEVAMLRLNQHQQDMGYSLDRLCKQLRATSKTRCN